MEGDERMLWSPTVMVMVSTFLLLVMSSASVLWSAVCKLRAWSAPRTWRMAAFRSCSICHRCLATATTAMSSAKPTIRTSPSKLRRKMASYMTFHRIGPKTDPCGTPAVTT
ncbi:unnamed protein product [Trichogramma brassicae]|uniref:Uncharacterized protein n=1 Tax=Trichogramma brassicae TaxID=86971 RepID=A0A6H5J1R9_9HYME|nr:unnamed protein product [Trichogramma brassicae]